MQISLQDSCNPSGDEQRTNAPAGKTVCVRVNQAQHTRARHSGEANREPDYQSAILRPQFNQRVMIWSLCLSFNRTFNRTQLHRPSNGHRAH
jgi:hypothetical protein